MKAIPEDSSAAQPYAASLFKRTGYYYFPLALVARVPFAMMVVGVLTLVVSARHSLELGGMASAVVGIASALIGPLVGAAADRYGQRPALLSCAIAHSVALLVLAWTAWAEVPNWVMLSAAFAVGASSPQPSPMSRSRLVLIIQKYIAPKRRPRLLSTTLAYESAADEVVFVFGPVIVGLLATAFDASVPIIAASALTLLSITAFALHHTSVPPHTRAERQATLAPAADLAKPLLVVVVAGIAGVGLVFGTTLTSLTAFMQRAASPESAGLYYGLLGLGSALLAISVSLFPAHFRLRYRWLLFAAVVLVGEVFFATATTIPQIALGLTLAGIGLGPVLVTLYSLAAARSPRGRSATVMTMLGSAVVLGQSLSAAATGLISERVSVKMALLLPVLAAVVLLLTAGWNWFLVSRASADSARI